MVQWMKEAEGSVAVIAKFGDESCPPCILVLKSSMSMTDDTDEANDVELGDFGRGAPRGHRMSVMMLPGVGAPSG